MSYQAAKDTISDMELRRFAACLLHTKDINNTIDWDAAATDFDPTGKTKKESFRTFVQRAIKKYGGAEGGGGADAAGATNGRATGKVKGSAGAKRKTAALAVEGGEEDDQPKRKRARGKKGAKVKEEAAEETTEAAEEAIEEVADAKDDGTPAEIEAEGDEDGEETLL